MSAQRLDLCFMNNKYRNILNIDKNCADVNWYTLKTQINGSISISVDLVNLHLSVSLYMFNIDHIISTNSKRCTDFIAIADIAIGKCVIV